MVELREALRPLVGGVPIDCLSLQDVVDRIDHAILGGTSLFLSTANANFLRLSRLSAAFKQSLLASDLCTADGIGVMLVSRALGAPIGERVTGADIMELLSHRRATAIGRPLRIFFLGGAPGVAEEAARRVNEGATGGLVCVGALEPGFGTLDQQSRTEVLDAVRAAKADILVVALGAERGQAWLARNAEVLGVPVYTHFGAALNFLAGTLRRAPPVWRRLGLEWLWRILQEPHLLRRYAEDARALARIFAFEAAPLALLRARDGLRRTIRPEPFTARWEEGDGEGVLVLEGAVVGQRLAELRAQLRRASSIDRPLVLDLAAVTALDTLTMGELARFHTTLAKRGVPFTCRNVPLALTRVLRLASADWPLGRALPADTPSRGREIAAPREERAALVLAAPVGGAGVLP